jgi:hypothetical protein
MTEHVHAFEVEPKSGIRLCSDPACRQMELNPKPDTGAVEALLALFADDGDLMVVERSDPSLEISTDSLRSEVRAALSTANTQGEAG